MKEYYDLVVIGAGPGGYTAAIRAAQEGLSTALVERQTVGGTCLNRGCIPTKALLHSASLYRSVLDGEADGVSVQGASYSLEKMYARKDAVVAQLRNGVEQLLRANKVDLIHGSAQIAGPGRVLVEGNPVSAGNILIAAGSEPARPPIPGIEHALTSDELLQSPHACDRLLIIGGGVIGMEFASFYNALGREVVVVEALERILPTLDREIAQNLSMILKKRGVQIFTGARVEEILPDGARFSVKGELRTEQADAVLVATGRRAALEGLFAEGFSVQTERGHIVTDGQFATSVPGIWAIGDATGGIQLAHVAAAQATAAVGAICGKAYPVHLETVPSCVYTDPEIASVGLSADEAKAQGIAVKQGKFLMTANGRSLIERADRGFIKLVFAADTGRVLGAQMMCPRATDLIGELACAVANGLTQEQLASVIRPHPTFCEGITEAAEAAEGRSVHSAPPRR